MALFEGACIQGKAVPVRDPRFKEKILAYLRSVELTLDEAEEIVHFVRQRIRPAA